MTQPDDWSADLARVIAGEVRRYRRLRGLSAQQLADRTAELGMPIQRSVLANLESGRRTTVTVAELAVLAAALSVAPVLLVFPVGRAEQSRLLPTASAPTWAAAQWFGGHGDYPGSSLWDRGDAEEPDPFGYRLPVQLYERHQDVVRRWEEASVRVGNLRVRVRTENGDIADVLRAAEETVTALEGILRDVRDRMAREGLSAPSLPPELASRLAEAVR